MASCGTQFCISFEDGYQDAKTVSSEKSVTTVELALELVQRFSTCPYNHPLCINDKNYCRTKFQEPIHNQLL